MTNSAERTEETSLSWCSRRWIWLGLVSLIGLTGCTPESADVASQAEINLPELQKRLDDALDYTFAYRRLNTQEHGAWQILHGVLTYQKSFPVVVSETGKVESAIEYLLNGGSVDGWEFRPGDRLPNGRIGLRAVMQPGTKRGQGHADQWLAVIAQCGYPAERVIRIGSTDYTIADLVGQVQLDVSNNADLEYSWTLIGLSTYLPSDATWKANDGDTWSIERLIEIELEQDLNDSACGGTHRLIGVTMALDRRRESGQPITEVWSDAESSIQNAIRVAKETQNPDGSFSPNYFARPGQTADLATQLAATGHILEFLSLAMPASQLKEDWVRRAAAHLCSLFDETKEIPLECGALYHAAHGLVLYREKCFGAKSYRLDDLNQISPSLH